MSRSTISRRLYTIHLHTVCPRCWTWPTAEEIRAALAATEPEKKA